MAGGGIRPATGHMRNGRIRMFAIAISVGAFIVAVVALVYAVTVGNDTENVWREFNRGTGIRGGSVRRERARRLSLS